MSKYFFTFLLFCVSSDAFARGGGGDGGGFIAIAFGGFAWWITSRFIGNYFGFLLGLIAFGISAVFIKYISLVIVCAMFTWFLYSFFSKKN